METEGSSNPSIVGSRAESRADPGWKYCKPAEANNTSGCVCNYCGKTTWGGITRMKDHLTGKKGNCRACTKCPKEVKEELLQYAKNKKKKDSEAIQRMRHDLLDDLNYGDSDEERALDEGFRDFAAPKPNNASGTKSASKGPIDLFFRRPETDIERKKKEKSRQSSIKGGL